MPIFRRKNCIHTASGIFALCKRLPSTLVESGLQNKENCALKLVDEIIIIILTSSMPSKCKFCYRAVYCLIASTDNAATTKSSTASIQN